MARFSFTMNILQRTKAAIQRVFQRKAFSFAWPAWRADTPQWHLTNYRAYVEEGFNLNTLIYSAIMYKVRAQTSAPLRAYTGDVDDPEPLDADHPLSQLVARPNPHQSFVEFQGQNIVYLNIGGNCYILMVRSARGGLPEAMYSLRPDRVFIVPGMVDGKATLLGFLYVPEGRTAWGKWGEIERREALHEGRVLVIAPEDMMHVKFPNPGDPLEGMGYGLPPVAPGARSTDVDNSITHFLKLFFDHGVVLPGILKTDQPLDPKVVSRIRGRWKDLYGGYDRWAEEIGVLERGLTYQRIGLGFDEMGFDGLDERNESRILGPFGVPPILIGSRIGLERATYANYKEARLAFWQDTMLPENYLYEIDYRYYLAGEGDAFVAFNYSRVPAFQEIRESQVDRTHEAFTAGAVTRNEYRRALGLPDVPAGDVFVISPMMLEVPLLLQPQERTAEGEASAEEETRKGNVVPLQLKKKTA